METCVLIPKELSLGARKEQPEGINFFSKESNLTVWTNVSVPQGTKIFPFQGTVRIDHLEVYSYLSPTDMRHRYGCYDEVSSVGKRKVRHCNWVRFVHQSMVYSPQVNIVGSKCKGEPVFEVVRTIPANTELVVYFLPDSLMEEILVPAIHYFRYSLYRQTLSKILDAAPLDLSMSLLTHSCKRGLSLDVDERKSISSESIASSNDLEPFTLQQTTKRKLKEKSLLPCEVCCKSFDRPSLLKRHMRTHTGEKPHVCDVCGKGFSTSSSLNTHRRIHSGEKPHQCGVCGKRFTASSNLYYHRMTHIKEKPHKCHLCSKSFPTPGDLKSHMYVHNGSWPYKCHICNRGFSKNTNLKNHLFLHTGHKPHACDLCNKRFALACNLRAHLKTHEGGSPQSTCQKCSKKIPLDCQLCSDCTVSSEAGHLSTLTNRSPDNCISDESEVDEDSETMEQE